MKKSLLFILVYCVLLFQCADIVKDEAVLLKPPAPVKLYNPQKIFATGAVITWDKTPDNSFSAYKLYYDTLPGIDESSILAATIFYKDSTAFTLQNLWENSTYYVTVFTYSSDNFSKSNEMFFKTSECTCNVFTGTRVDGMVLIPSGCFVGKEGSMGTISYDFFLDTTEITEAEWFLIMNDSVVASQKPKGYVSWFQTILFCNKKSKKFNKDTCYSYAFPVFDTTTNNLIDIRDLACVFTKNGFRLPTEDEWEYAYRAGGWEEYYWGKDGNTQMEYPYNADYPKTAADTLEIGEYAWWSNNNGIELKDIAQKLPNKWSLYDMAGNIWEFVWDIMSAKRIKTRFNYTGPATGPQSESWRIIRGGSYTNEHPRFFTAWWRTWPTIKPDETNNSVGFRTVRRNTP